MGRLTLLLEQDLPLNGGGEKLVLLLMDDFVDNGAAESGLGLYFAQLLSFGVFPVHLNSLA